MSALPSRVSEDSLVHVVQLCVHVCIRISEGCVVAIHNRYNLTVVYGLFTFITQVCIMLLQILHSLERNRVEEALEQPV